MILTHNQLALENSLRRILPAGVVSCWIPDGYDKIKDVIGGNHGKVIGAHPNVEVIQQFGPNKLTDGGLNLWDDATHLTHWEEVTAGDSTVNREATEKIEGDYSCRLDVDASQNNVNIWQGNIPLTPLKRCRLVVRYKNSVAGKTAYIRFKDSGTNVTLKSDGTWQTPDATITLSNSTIWKKFELDFYAHANYSNYVFYLVRKVSASSSIYLDNISIKEVVSSVTNPSVGHVFGGDDAIDLTGLTCGGTSHSFSCWAYPRDSERDNFFFDSSSGRLVFAWTGFPEKIGVFDGAWRQFSDPPSKYLWHYITFSLNGSTSKMKMFLNGSQYGSEIGYTPCSIGGAIAMGSRFSKDQAFFNGYMVIPSLAEGAWSLQQHNNVYLATKGMFAPRG